MEQGRDIEAPEPSLPLLDTTPPEPRGGDLSPEGYGGIAPEVKVAGMGRTEAAKAILEHLNIRAGRSFRPTDTYLKAISARLADVKGDVDGILAMIDRQCALWSADPQMAEFLNPTTLFRPTKFPRYYDDRLRPITAPGARNGNGSGVRPHRNDFVGTPESRAAWEAQCAADDQSRVEGY